MTGHAGFAESYWMASTQARLVPHRELVLAADVDRVSDPDGMNITRADNTRSVRTPLEARDVRDER